MEFIKDFEGVVSFINSVKEGESSMFYMPVGLLPELVAALPGSFDASFLGNFNADPVGFVESRCRYGSAKYIDFEDAGCGKAVHIAAMYVGCEAAPSVWVNDIYTVLEYEGKHYNVYSTRTHRLGMSLFGAAENVQGIHYDGQPNYFTKPSAKVVARWAAWLNGCEVRNIEEIAKVKELHDRVRSEVVASGLEYSEQREGLSVKAGPINIGVKFCKSGVNYEYRINYSAIGFGSDAFASLLTAFGRREDTPKCEEAVKPKEEDKKPSAYRVFKSLEVESVDGADKWTSAALKVLQVAAADSSAVVSDICKRALNGLTRLSDKQKWCVAYAFTRSV